MRELVSKKNLFTCFISMVLIILIYKFSFVSMSSDNLLPEREQKEVLASVKNEFNDKMEIGHLTSLSLTTEKFSQLVMAYLTEKKLMSQVNQDQFVGVEVKF